MFILRYLSLVSAASALAVTVFPPTTHPSHRHLQARETTTSPSPTAAPTGVFITTKYNIIPGVTNDYVTIPEKTIAIAIPTCIQTIIPDNNGFVPPGTCGSLYDYYPSFVAAVVTSVLFGVLTFAHIVQAVKLKKVNPLLTLTKVTSELT
jgi:hypothetical protein